MCRSSNQPGGAKRCVAHVRSELNHSAEVLVEAKSHSDVANVLKDALLHPKVTFFTGSDKNMEVVRYAFGKLLDEESAEEAMNLYISAWVEVMDGNAGFDSVDGKVKLSLFEAFNNIGGEKYFNHNEIVSDYLQANSDYVDKLKEYRGTEEGFLEVAESASAWDENGKPTAELKNAVIAFSYASNLRESARRRKMEQVRLHAKNTTRGEDWAEYQKWQDAWNADPTLIQDQWDVEGRDENGFIVLRARRLRWKILLKRNNKGRVQRIVDFSH